MPEKKFVPSEYQLVVDAKYKGGTKKRQNLDMLVTPEEKDREQKARQVADAKHADDDVRRRDKRLAIPPDVERGSSDAVWYGLRNSIIVDREQMAKEPDNEILKTNLKYREIEKSLLDSLGVHSKMLKLAESRGGKGLSETKITARDMIGIIDEVFNSELRKMVMEGSKMDDVAEVGGIKGRIGDLFEAMQKLRGTLEAEDSIQHKK